MRKAYKMPRPGQQVSSKELRRLAEDVNRSESATATIASGIGHGIEHVKSAGGQSMLNNRYRGFWAQIMDRDNSTPRKYTFLELQQSTEGVFILHSYPRIGTDATASYPAYEVADANVPLGAVVWMQLGYNERYYIFSYAESPVPAKITGTSGAPSSTLNGALAAEATSLTITAATNFPGRNDFHVVIDNEYLKVTAGAGTTGWTVTRGVDSTLDAPHLDAATVTLAGAYSWDEQKPDDNGGWQDETGNKRTGTAIKEPAYERNHNNQVPTGTFVLLFRRTEKLAGASTLSAGIAAGAVTIPMTARDSFPQTGDFYIMLTGGDGTEIMLVTAGNGAGAGNFTASRGQFGTTAEAWDTGDDIAEVLIEWVFDYPFRPDDDLTAKVYKDTATTVTAGASTALSAPSEEWDTHAFHAAASDTKITFQDSGPGLYLVEYSVEASVTFSADLAPQLISSYVRLNGAGGAIRGSEDCEAVLRLNSAPAGINTCYNDGSYTSTNAFVERLALTSSCGVWWFGSIKNTHVANSIDIRFDLTDSWGATDQRTITLLAGAFQDFSSAAFDLAGASPVLGLMGTGSGGTHFCYTTISIKIKSTVADTAGTTEMKTCYLGHSGTTMAVSSVCLGETFLIDVGDSTYDTDYIEVIGVAHPTLDTAFDDLSFEIVKLNRAGRMAL